MFPTCLLVGRYLGGKIVTSGRSTGSSWYPCGCVVVVGGHTGSQSKLFDMSPVASQPSKAQPTELLLFELETTCCANALV